MTDRSAQFTGSIPAAYDRYLGPMLFEPYAADLVARVAVPSKAAVLELACGTGILTQRLRRALPVTVTLTATDLNEPMVAYARGKMPNAPVTWQQADAQQLPFPDGAFDAVACQFGFMFVPDKAKAFGEVRRVLKPHGLLAFNVWLGLEENSFGNTYVACFTGPQSGFGSFKGLVPLQNVATGLTWGFGESLTRPGGTR